MGLSDRDYARAGDADRWGGGRGGNRRNASGGPMRGPGGGTGSGVWRGLSATTWLIVINVAVYVLGMALMFVPWGIRRFDGPVRWLPDVTAEVQARARPAPADLQRPPAALTLYDPMTSRAVGTKDFRLVTLDEYWGHFSTDRAFARFELWRFLTFQFLHAGIWHLVLNMVALFVFGPLVEDYLGSKRYLALYLVCGIFGALSYLLLNLGGYLIGPHVRLPGLLFDDPRTPLVGASAGIFGIMLAAAFVAPQRMLYLLGVLPMRLKPAVYMFLGLAVINLFFGSVNKGGEAAHVGGALAGYYFIRRMYLLRDFFDVLGDGAEPRGQARAGNAPQAATEGQARVDEILGKISREGLSSLTDEERAFLEKTRGTLGGGGDAAGGVGGVGGGGGAGGR